MKKIEEYIFYRVYTAYQKKDDIPLFSSVMYIIAIYMALSLFICGSIANLVKSNDFPYDKGVFIIWYSYIIIYVLRKYYNKSIRNRILNHNSLKRKLFPNWFYFLLLPLSIILGIVLYSLCYVYIIKQYNLVMFQS